MKIYFFFNPVCHFSKIVRVIFPVKLILFIHLLMKRLSDLSVGSIVRIHSFEKDEIFLKLMEMGCVPGEIIKVEKVAPLGDPISVAIAGYSLSLRLDEAKNIFVEELN
jgi:ferrous iron transport protein A